MDHGTTGMEGEGVAGVIEVGYRPLELRGRGGGGRLS